MEMRVLLLGGTTEATALANMLHKAGVDAIFSYAGRTLNPLAQSLPTRKGGFGGSAGLAHYIVDHGITHVIDATHPFAAGMSHNVVTMFRKFKIPILRVERPAWKPQKGDNWTMVPDMEGLPGALPDTPARVFLAIGKQRLDLFAAKPQHHYLLRLVDAPEGDLPLPDAEVVVARPPFTVAAETALMADHRITHLVCKNGGGRGAEAKLVAARHLGIRVIMADRPVLPKADIAATAEEAMAWLAHSADRGV